MPPARRNAPAADALASLASAAEEAVTLAEAAETVLPRLAAALSCSFACAYEITAEGRTREHTMPGHEAFMRGVVEYDDNPVRDIIFARQPARRWAPTDFVTADRFERTAIFADYLRPREIERPVLVPLSAPPWNAAGFCGLLLARSRRQPTWADPELRALDALLPRLAGVARRHQRERLRTGAWQELLALPQGRAAAAFDPEGRPLATTRVYDRRGEADPRLPAALAEAARDAMAHRTGRSGAARPVTLPGGAQATLSVGRDPARGEPIVVAVLAATRDVLARRAERYGLTPAEVNVCRELAAGKTNAEIAAALFVSPATVRTHLYRIFDKLGVATRLKAVVLLSEG